MCQFSPKQINLLKILQTSSGYTTINLNTKRKKKLQKLNMIWMIKWESQKSKGGSTVEKNENVIKHVLCIICTLLVSQDQTKTPAHQPSFAHFNLSEKLLSSSASESLLPLTWWWMPYPICLGYSSPKTLFMNLQPLVCCCTLMALFSLDLAEPEFSISWHDECFAFFQTASWHLWPCIACCLVTIG